MLRYLGWRGGAGEGWQMLVTAPKLLWAGDKSMANAHPHPGLLPRETENRSPSRSNAFG